MRCSVSRKIVPTNRAVNGHGDDDADVEASGAAYRCEGGREEVHLAIKKLAQSARNVDLEKARRDIGMASAKAHSTEPAPGFDAGARAGLRRNEQGRPVWVVPRAGQPLSMFDASFWTSVDPLRFPYGDGVFGLQRPVSLSYEDWVRYLLERVELEYHCDVPWWDSEPASLPDCAPAARAARSEGNVLFREGAWALAVIRYGEALDIDPSSAVLFSNRSAAFAKLGEFHKALEDATACVRCDARWWKGHLRRGFAFEQLGESDAAILAYAMAHRLNPHGRETRAALCRVLVSARTPAALEPDRFVDCQVSALDVRFGVERAALAMEEAQMRVRKQLLIAARARVASNPEEWRACLQLALALMARAVDTGDSDSVIQQLQDAKACFADACRLATAARPDLAALVALAESRSLRLLEERVFADRRRNLLVEWFKDETEPDSLPEGDRKWLGCVQITGDTPQGCLPQTEEMVLDGDLSQGGPAGCPIFTAASEMETHDDDGGGVGNDSSSACRKGPPRWRGNRDLLTMLYCLWRRRRYISSARFFADKKSWQQSLKDLGQVSAQDFLDTMELCGKGASMTEVLQNEAVPRRVKAALRTLNLCMNHVVGTNAHRTLLRHQGFGYRLLWGAPLVFTTPNVADTKHAMVKLLYEGDEVAAWRLLEEDDPDLGQKEEMLRRVAEDPFAQAVFSDLMIRLYLEHCVGVHVDFRDGLSDSACARLMTPGLFGVVQAFFGPVETQGRGGLHAHVSVWVKNFMGGWIIDKLRNGSLSKEEKDEMDVKLRNWRNAVLEAVGTMQFDCVEEFARQMGVQPEDLDSLPLSKERQAATYMDGQVESADAQVLRAPVQAFPAEGEEGFKVHVPWRDDPPCGPSRKRPFAVLQGQEPRTPNPSSQQPAWRRLPRFVVDSVTGQARSVGLAGSKKAEARIFAKIFSFDARRNFCKSHMHRCMPTCFPTKKSGKPGDQVRICRFGFYHFREVAAYPRRWPKKLRRCRKQDCPRERHRDKIWVVEPKSGRLRLVDVHPWYCAVKAAVPSEKDVRRYFRKGKDLVLPVEDVSPGEPGCHPVKAADGDFVTTRAGESVCIAYNHGACSDACEHGSIHVCRICLGSHRSTECDVAHKRSRTAACSLSGKGDLDEFSSKPHPAKDHRGRFVTTYDGLVLCACFSSTGCQQPCPFDSEHLCQWCLGSHVPGECPKLKCEEKGIQHPQRDSLGRALTSLDGRLLCSAYNVGRCDGVCRNKREHLCWYCLGRHNARDCHRYRPQVDSREGKVGSSMSLRYHPDCGSSNPAAQSLFRCNVDIQCTDRVYVLVLKQKRRRWRRKLVVSASQEQDGGAVDSGSRVGDLEEDLSLPAAAAGSSTLHNEGMPGDDSAVAGGGADLEASPGPIPPAYSKLKDGQILESYLNRRQHRLTSERSGGVSDSSKLDAAGDSCIRRAIVRDTRSTSHAVLNSLLCASRDMAGFEDEAVRSSLVELREEWFLALGKRKAEATSDVEFGHDLLGSGRGKAPLDAGDSRKCDLGHIEDCPDSPVGVTLPEDCSLATPTSPSVSQCLPREAMDVDSVEPGCAGDANDGVDDYMVASPGSDIEGHPGSPGFFPPEEVETEYGSLSGMHVDFDVACPDIGFPDDLPDDVTMHLSVTGGVDWVGPMMPDEFDSAGSASDHEGKTSCCESVKFEVVEEEHELLVPPSKEEVYASELTQDGRLASVVLAVTRMMQDMSNLAYYTTKYSTKEHPGVKAVLPEQAVGVERLRLSEEDAQVGARSPAEWSDIQLEAGRKTLIRLETAANRAQVKKLSEMVFQMYFGHECYQSHQSWTIFCKGLVKCGFRAAKRRELIGDPDLSWWELERYERDRILSAEEKAEADFSKVEADMADDFDVFATDRSTLRVKASKQSATVSAGDIEASDALRSSSSQGVLGMLLQTKPTGTVDVSEHASVLGDNEGCDANNDCDEAAKPAHSDCNSEAEFWESLDSVGCDDAPKGCGKRPKIARPPAVPVDVSEGLHGDLPEEKRARFAEDSKLVEDTASEPVTPLRRSTRLAKSSLRKQELPAAVAEPACAKNVQIESDAEGTPKIARPPAVPVDVSEGLHGDLPEEKRARFEEDSKLVEDTASEPVTPLRRSSRLAKSSLRKQELPAAVVEPACAKNVQIESDAEGTRDASVNEGSSVVFMHPDTEAQKGTSSSARSSGRSLPRDPAHVGLPACDLMSSRDALSGEGVSEGRSRGTARGACSRGAGRGRGSRRRRRRCVASVAREGDSGSASLDGGREAGVGPSPLVSQQVPSRGCNRRLWPGAAASARSRGSAKAVREEEDRAPERGSAATGAVLPVMDVGQSTHSTV